MKNLIKSIYISFTVIIILSIFSVYASASVHESEPNDSFATANSISANTVIKGSAYSHSDDYHDYYQLIIEKPGYINITIKHDMFEYSPINHHFGVTLYRYDGSEFYKIGYMESLYDSEINRFGEKYIEASRYYIDVENPLDDILIEYELDISFKEEKSTTKKTTTTSKPTTTTITQKPTTSKRQTTQKTTEIVTTKDYYSNTTKNNNNIWTTETTLNADTTYTYNDFVYRINDSNVIIVNYLGTDEAVKIPNEINNMPVTKISDNAFQNVSYIYVPNSVTSFGYNALGERNNPDLIIGCQKDSAAEKYAIANKIKLSETNSDVIIENPRDKTKIIITIICAVVVIVVAICVTVIFLSKNNKKNS